MGAVIEREQVEGAQQIPRKKRRLWLFAALVFMLLTFSSAAAFLYVVERPDPRFRFLQELQPEVRRTVLEDDVRKDQVAMYPAGDPTHFDRVVTVYGFRQSTTQVNALLGQNLKLKDGWEDCSTFDTPDVIRYFHSGKPMPEDVHIHVELFNSGAASTEGALKHVTMAPGPTLVIVTSWERTWRARLREMLGRRESVSW